MNKGTHLSAATGAEGNLSATHIEGISKMRKYRVVGLIFSLMLIAAACSESTGTTAAPSAVATAAIEDGAHETGEEAHIEEAVQDEGEAEHTEDAAAHDEAEAAHDEGDHDMADMDADRTIEVTMTEFAFDSNPITVSAGETIEFVITNAGAIEHEFRVSNDHRVEEHLAGGHADHEEGTGGHHEDADQYIVVQPGETASLMVMFGEDTSIYTNIVCLIPGHFEAGMEAGLEYTA